MVYVTGDLHGELERFTKTEIRKLRKDDVLIVCGDFGFVWDGSEEEKKRLEKIGKQRFSTVFVTGCHDNYDLLREYPEETWCGGRVRLISGRLRQLCRGEIYTIEGKTFFVFGGGESIDSALRAESDFWWPEEQPSEEEMENALSNLAEQGGKVDYVITHDMPAGLSEFLGRPAGDSGSRIGGFLEQVEKTVSFKQWFFGKIHQDRAITNRHRAVYLKVVPLG